ncbi:MAG: HIRAN domain-containing protein [Proteobacteria bacterium]|nr:HIRAN domain-containing protein [Pseudomonadota bacterium]
MQKKGRSFHTKVVGVTFRNNDGSDRQDIIARCRPGDELALSSEPENPHADHAVAVYCNQRRWFRGVKTFQIGYLPEESGVAAGVFEHIEAGGGGEAQITDVTGGTRDKPTMGVNIRITLWGG